MKLIRWNNGKWHERSSLYPDRTMCGRLLPDDPKGKTIEEIQAVRKSQVPGRVGELLCGSCFN